MINMNYRLQSKLDYIDIQHNLLNMDTKEKSKRVENKISGVSM